MYGALVRFVVKAGKRDESGPLLTATLTSRPWRATPQWGEILALACR